MLGTRVEELEAAQASTVALYVGLVGKSTVFQVSALSQVKVGNSHA